MKRVPIGAVVFVLGLSCLAQGKKDFRVELRLPETEYILGEPIWCQEVFFSAPLTPQGAMDWEAVYVKGPVRAACHAERRKVETGMQIGKPEPGPPEFTRTFLLSDCGIVDAGEYELWTEYPADLYFDRTYAPTPTAKLVSSNHILVRIAAPSGIDAEVFKAHHEACNKITLSPEELLEKFSASTYAVYALAQHYGLKGGAIPLDAARTRAYLAELQKNGAETLKDKTRHFACGPDGNELHDAKGDHIPITVEQYLRDSIAQAESICSRHPGLGLCDQIRFNVIAYDYLELLQFQDAASAFRSLQQEATDPQLRENCGKMLEVLNEMGLDGSGDSKVPAAPAKDK